MLGKKEVESGRSHVAPPCQRQSLDRTLAGKAQPCGDTQTNKISTLLDTDQRQGFCSSVVICGSGQDNSLPLVFFVLFGFGFVFLREGFSV